MEQGVDVGSRKLLKGLERETGIEPATSSLGSWHSTAELLPLAESLRLDNLTFPGIQCKGFPQRV